MLKEFWEQWKEDREIDKAYQRTLRREEKEARKEDREIAKVYQRTLREKNSKDDWL